MQFEEFRSFWENAGIVIFDTNVYLNLYNFPLEVTKEILTTLDTVRDRIWLPYQVYTEFQANKKEAVNRSFSKYERIQLEADKVFEDTVVKLYDILGRCDKFRYPMFGDTLDSVVKAIQEARTELGGANEEIAHEKEQNKQFVKKDIVADFLESLKQQGQFGTEFKHSDLIKIYVEGDTRYRLGIPPGFRDSQKLKTLNPDDYIGKRKAFGDLVIWKEIIKHATQIKKDIMFITDDIKSDWWKHIIAVDDKTEREYKKLIGPHDELVKEFQEYSDERFYMLTFDGFIENLSGLNGFVASMKLHYELNKANILEYYIRNRLRHSDDVDINYIVHDLDSFFEYKAKKYSVSFENIVLDKDRVHFSINGNMGSISGRFVIDVFVDGTIHDEELTMKSVLFKIECECAINLEVNTTDFHDYTVLEGNIDYIKTISDDVIATISDDIDLYTIYDVQRHVQAAVRTNSEDSISLYERKLYDAFRDIKFYPLEQLDGII